MTVSIRTATFAAQPAQPARLAEPRRSTDHQALRRPLSDRKAFWLTMAALLVLFGLLQNPFWVPAGDSEVYIAIARNLARGDGYQFNGEPVAMVPPGWPAMMAGLMKVAPSFLALKLLAMSCMLAALACAYWICRRFVAPGSAALVVLLTALLSPVYQATFWLISESAFCLISAASLLVAFQVKEGPRQWWRIALLAGLCAAAVLVRWAGVLGVLLVVAVLLDGQILPRLNRRWAAAALCGLVTVGTFIALRQVLSGTPEQRAATKEVTGEQAVPEPPPATRPITGSTEQVAHAYSLITSPTGRNGYLERVVGWGRWLGWLYWQPFRAAAGSRAIEVAGNLVGWLLLLLLFVPALTGVVRRQWLWLAVLVYCGVLAINWPSPNARYLVPVAFLLTLGVVLAAQQLHAAWSHPLWRGGVRAGLVAFALGVVLCNGALWAVETSIARSGDFYGAYEAGTNQHLIAAARYLNRLDLQDGEIAVTPRYQNLNRRRSSPFGLRATTLLTGKTVMSLPKQWQKYPPSAHLSRWLARNGVKYYIHQAPLSPWRVWHFRVGWWQESRTGKPAQDGGPPWQLWRVEPSGRMVLIKLKPSSAWPTRVPGLDQADGIGSAAAAKPASGETRR